MKKELTQLNVGDTIYLKNKYGIQDGRSIDRVTNTMAFAGNKKFKRSFDSDFFYSRGGRNR